MGKSKSQTVGYKYFLGMHTVLAEKLDSVLALKFSDRIGWEGTPLNDQITVNEPDLFGGEGREGGVSGTVDVMLGAADQEPNDYLQLKLGDVIPAFRRVASLVFRQFYFGNNPYLKPMAVKATGIHCHGDDWYPEKAPIGAEYGANIDDAMWYVAIDVSNSMPTRLNDLTAHMTYFLNQMRDRGFAINIKMVAFETVVRSQIEVRNATDADYDAMIAWLEGLGTGGGNDYEVGFSLAPAWFAGSVLEYIRYAALRITGSTPVTGFVPLFGEAGRSGERRIAILLTDGLLYEKIEEAKEITDAIEGLEIYAFSVASVVTEGHTILDNTPSDGVPIIAQPDPTTVFESIFPSFLAWVDMNPAHILRDALGRKLGYDRFGSTWATVADQLYDEGFGLSFHWKTPSATEEFVKLVERHVDMQHYEDPQTGKIEVVLIRDDYDVETLTTFDASNIAEWGDVSWPQPEELPNQITVTWSKRDDTQGSVTIANIAAVQAMGRIVPETIDYPGITTHALASRVCLRDLAARTTSLAAGSFYATHIDPALHEGSAIIVDEPRLGLDAIVARITRIEESNGEDNRALIEFVQDKFALGASGIVVDGGEAEPPANEALAADLRLVEEAPYYALVIEQGQAAVDDALTDEPDQGALLIAAGNPEDRHQDYVVATDIGSGYEGVTTGDFAPATTLVEALSGAADVTTARVVYTAALSYVPLGSLATIGSEHVRIDAMEIVGGVVEMTIGRGCIDTPPVAHAAGETVIFWQAYATTDEVAYLATEEVDVKLLPRTGSDELALADAATDTVTFASRAIRPYPVGQLKIEASYTYTDILPEPATLTWAHRDRLFQTTTTPEDHDDASIGPEASVAYTVEVRAVLPITDIFDRTDFFAHPDVFTDTGAGTLVRSEAVATAVTWDYEEETDVFDVGVTDIFALPDFFGFVTGRAIRAEFGVRVTRDGYDNWQTARIRARHLAAPFGLEAEGY